MAGITIPADIDTTPEDRFYTELGRQDLTFEQTLAELIDNSISAGSKNIEVHIFGDNDKVRLIIGDDGSGISISDLVNRVLRMGAPPTNPGSMNEHGFGLKNSIARLTGGKEDFKLLTKDPTDKKLYIIRGPLSSRMKVDLPNKSEEKVWDSNITKLNLDTGTRVYAETNLIFLNTTLHKLYERGPRPTKLEQKQIDSLKEHLGVFYRPWLDSSHKIFIKWAQGNGTLNIEEVKALPIPYKREPAPNRISISVNGKECDVYYRVGELDRDLSAKSGFRIYYQGNQRTQGIDVIFRKRVILPHLLTELFGLARHNSLNSFIGDLTVEDPLFSTFNNKTGLDQNNPFVAKLLEELITRYMPSQASSGAYDLRESQLRKQIASTLEKTTPNSSAQQNAPIWSRIGVSVDIIHQLQNGDEILYEIKDEEIKPLDLYQVVMYWDGRVEDNKRPQIARIVSPEDISSKIKLLIKYINQRKDAKGKPYKIEFVHADEILGISKKKA